ncbi:glycoside hydrolase family 27 protein [Occallatibacter savannae]|uniref:glycoside hydrolase family 27 protein n=1 Tax=Occallatibacter savannae TaxID=1002691 RepID=UPI0013A5B412|nr:glycoside hydrolase family 27 protein [Occallatibacter savannae]
MGWNSWNSFANIVNSQIVQQQAKAMASNGMKEAGYEYVVIDEGWWLGERDSAGNIVVNPKQWPAIQPGQKDGDMANIASYIHSLGLKAGIYTDAGRDGCSMYPDSGPKLFNAGSEGHYDQDFLQFSKWGFDYVKVDWCGGAKERRSGAIQYAQIAHAIQNAEKTTGRKLFFSICEWGSQNPWYWGPGVGDVESTIWRTGGDIIPPIVESLHDPEHDKRVITARNLLDSFDTGMHPEAQHTGYFNDLDMMVMGMRGMTEALDRTHMGLWAISSAPLMIGSDLTRLSPSTLSLLTNREALAIHHDPFGLQPIKVDETTPGVQIWVKPMAIAGRRAIGILNRTDTSAQIRIDWEKLGLKGAPRSLRDVWNGRDVDVTHAAVSVPAHDLVLMLADGEDKLAAEYSANNDSFAGIQATGGPTFARLEYANRSSHVVVTRVKSTSGLFTAVALPPTTGSDTGTIGLILPRGTADLSFEGRPVTVSRLKVQAW